jgi:ribosome-binding protein aMBF1 (putative translation factor)
MAAMEADGPVGSTARAASDRRAVRSVEYRAERERLGPYREVARQVILLRTRSGISQEELARRVGTSKSAIARLESGRHQPTVETLRRVAAAFDVRLVIEFEAPQEPTSGLPSEALAL